MCVFKSHGFLQVQRLSSQMSQSMLYLCDGDPSQALRSEFPRPKLCMTLLCIACATLESGCPRVPPSAGRSHASHGGGTRVSSYWGAPAGTHGPQGVPARVCPRAAGGCEEYCRGAFRSSSSAQRTEAGGIPRSSHPAARAAARRAARPAGPMVRLERMSSTVTEDHESAAASDAAPSS